LWATNHQSIHDFHIVVLFLVVGDAFV
jgi:preprotein translocase subunit SecE